MVERSRPTQCERCGNPVQSDDRFCGVCGARVAPVTPEDPQIIPRPDAAAQTAPTRSNRSLLIAGLVGILLVLLVGGGAIALVGSGSGVGLFGGSDPEPDPIQKPVPPPKTTEQSTRSDEPTEDPEVASVSPDAPSDPAFDPYLPVLKDRTDAPIMLPAELPNELEYFGIDENVEGDSYSITFLNTPPDDLVGGWAMAENIGSLEVVPTSEFESDERFEVVSTEDVRLSDGTEAKLRYMQPVLDAAMYGSRWEGTFEKNGYTYNLSVLVSQDGYVVSKQALSTMVKVRGEVARSTEEFSETTESGSAALLGDDFVADAEVAAEEYYQAAGMEDWEYTYEHLDSETQSMFTLEEWVQKNQYYWNLNSISYDVLAVEMVDDPEETIAEVVVRVTGEDGSSFVRTTYWVLEDGEWLHRFGQEEIDLFMPDLSFEEFLEAQQ